MIGPRSLERAGALVLLSSLLAAGCTELDPYAEVVLTVDTDLPVPRLASRLRVDVYSDSGQWLESRDLLLADPSEWPTSFSVRSKNEQQPTRVLVRIRAYPDGKSRDYLGERAEPLPAPDLPPIAPTSVAEMCALAPKLELGSTVTLRVARTPFTELEAGGSFCAARDARSGATAAFVDIPESGSYRFAALSVVEPNQAMELQLRRVCDDDASAEACFAHDGPLVGEDRPDFVVPLGPGRYFVVVDTYGFYRLADRDDNTLGSSLASPSDVVVAVDRADAWNELHFEAPAVPEPPIYPLELADETLETPDDEPTPELTVDRLVALELEPGVVRRVGVTLRGECTGTPALLGADPAQRVVDLASAKTCVDVEGERRVVTQVEHEPFGTVSVQGRFAEGTPCLPSEAHATAVCVPGGVFVLGSALGAGVEPASVPERLVRLERFWIDRHEVTVADLRKHFWYELVYGSPFWDQPVLNPYPLPDDADVVGELCTVSSGALGREHHAATCVNWYLARAYCQHLGGDLPTVAQWEYVATAAWRARETVYPWGDEAPTCDRAVYGRYQPGESTLGSDACVSLGFGPQPVSISPGDATPSTPRVFGLGGGVREWMRDAMQPYDAPCWRGSRMSERACWQDHAPTRATRGGSWGFNEIGLYPTAHDGAQAGIIHPGLGFRCVYAERPR